MTKLLLKKDVNTSTKHEAFPYQYEAIEAIRDYDYAAIFHEQGLGKTKIAIDLMLYWLEKKYVDTVLIVVKKGLIDNWIREFYVHTHIKPQLLTQNRGANFHVFNSPARLMLTHYEVLKSESNRFKLFLKARDVAIILDESAKIKNPKSTVTQSLLELAPLFKRRVIMTGTPIANRPHDIWSQIWFLDHGKALGNNFIDFKESVELSAELAKNKIDQSRFEKNLDSLFAKISSFSVRETKNSGVIELPEKVINNIITDWEHYQFDLYCQIRNDLKAIVVKEGIPSEDKAENILKRLLRLLQIASNPILIDESYSCGLGKLPYLKDLVARIIDKKEKCIVWTCFNDNVDWLAKELRMHGTCRLHGRMAMDQRNRSVNKFLKDSNIRILIATPGVAKEGLTLTVANHVIFYDRGFSLGDYLQAQDRIHRISQEKKCYVHNLIMQESVDEWVDVLLHTKHLAAKLGQGDISLDYYKSQVSYDFAEILTEILGITKQKPKGKVG